MNLLSIEFELKNSTSKEIGANTVVVPIFLFDS